MAAVTSHARRVREPITVPERRDGIFPRMFVWRGQRHDVRAVEACRTEVRHNWRGDVRRHFFRVRTQAGIFEICQDLARDTWEVESVSSAVSAAPSGDAATPGR